MHPLPENVSPRSTTTAIVEKIQCEGRQALDDLTVGLLRKSSDPDTRRWADMIEDHTLKATKLIQEPKRYPIDPKLAPVFIAYTLSAVTFDFLFTISETNDNMANADLRLPVVGGLFTLGGAAEAKFQRQNTRKFEITNSFYELHDLDYGTCGKVAAMAGNVAYPITGHIGLEEVFSTFIKLDGGAGTTKKSGDASQFTDTLVFTTTLSASVNPKITLNPVPDLVPKLMDAGGTLSAMRVDVHQVAIAIARGGLLTSYAQAVAASSPYYLTVARADAKTKSLAIANANRVQFFFQNQQAINSQLGIIPPY